MSEEEEKTRADFAETMAEALHMVMLYANDKGYCPGCFITAFASAILAYEESKGFEHVDGKRVVKALVGEHDDEDTIGETAGNA